MGRPTLPELARARWARLRYRARSLASRGAELVQRSALRPTAAELAQAAARSRSLPRGALTLDLRGRIALVTGASGELGRVITRTLASSGADVAIHYYQGHDRALALQQEVARLGVRSLVVQADVTQPAAVQAMQQRVQSELGSVDTLVINAVAPFAWRSVMAQPVEEFDSQYRTSVRHAVLLAKAFVPAMCARGFGRVIGINSECAMLGNVNAAAYVAGKRGLDGLLRVLAKEVGAEQVTVNQVAPGWMISDKHRAAHTEREPEYERSVPLARRGCDQDVANAVAFLASELASFITGAYLPVAGGNVMPSI